MRIIGLVCPNCGTIVAGNVLERKREIKCPSIDCEEILKYADLPDSDREYMEENLELFRMRD